MGGSLRDVRSTVNPIDLVKATVGEFAKRKGFARRGSWYKNGEDVVVVLGTQKSQYANAYYLNLGFWLKEFGDVGQSSPEQCHAWLRLGTVMEKAGAPRDEVLEMEDLLRLESPIEDETRRRQLTDRLERFLEPIIDRGVSTSGLRQMVRDGLIPGGAIKKIAHEQLDVDQ